MSSYDPRTPSRRPLDYVEFGPGLVDDIDRRLIGDTRRRKVLDLGCGTSRLLCDMREAGYAGRLVGVDCAAAALRSVKERSESCHVELVEADARRRQHLLARVVVEASDVDRPGRRRHVDDAPAVGLQQRLEGVAHAAREPLGAVLVAHVVVEHVRDHGEVDRAATLRASKLP